MPRLAGAARRNLNIRILEHTRIGRLRTAIQAGFRGRRDAHRRKSFNLKAAAASITALTALPYVRKAYNYLTRPTARPSAPPRAKFTGTIAPGYGGVFDRRLYKGPSPSTMRFRSAKGLRRGKRRFRPIRLRSKRFVND